MEQRTFIVDENGEDLRIDKYLALLMEDCSRSYIQKIIGDQSVTVNGKSVKANYKVGIGDAVEIQIPDPVILDIQPENITLDILYVDDDILIINKPKDMVVHPAPGHYTGTLVNAVMYHCGDQLSTINGVLRPGIVHRIDKDTTGVLVICKNDKAHRAVAEQLAVHSITRAYHAIVYNNIKEDEGTVDAPIGRMDADRKKMGINRKNGRHAVTHYRVLERFGRYTYIECRLETGRTHQIRVHFASRGHPLAGDGMYGGCPEHMARPALHCGAVSFGLTGEDAARTVHAPLPEDMRALLAACGIRAEDFGI